MRVRSHRRSPFDTPLPHVLTTNALIVSSAKTTIAGTFLEAIAAHCANASIDVGGNVDLSDYRSNEREQARIGDLLALLPARFDSALDIGARDGFISKLLAERCDAVIALDLNMPSIEHERVRCVQGDIAALDFPDGAIDLVFCTEVLEHIPPPLLEQAASELARVARRYVLVGVPYNQDIRAGRTTCAACDKKNPPWGHVNSLDEKRLEELFPSCSVLKQSFVGVADGRTNFLAALLMDWAGNPYGTYTQDEPCIHCGAQIGLPRKRNLLQKVYTRLAAYSLSIQAMFATSKPNWIHILFEKRA